MVACCLVIIIPLVLGGLFRLLRAGGEDPGARRRGAALWVVLSLAVWTLVICFGGRTYWLQTGVLFQTILFIEVKVGEVIWAVADGAIGPLKRIVRRMRQKDAKRPQSSEESGMRA